MRRNTGNMDIRSARWCAFQVSLGRTASYDAAQLLAAHKRLMKSQRHKGKMVVKSDVRWADIVFAAMTGDQNVTGKVQMVLARAFAAEIRDVTSPDEQREIIRRNREYDAMGSGACATHEFFDANECMIAAWEKIFPTLEMDAGSEDQCILINGAWDIAKRNGFWFHEMSDGEVYGPWGAPYPPVAS